MADYDGLEDWIRTENGSDHSVDDQVVVARWFRDREVTIVDDQVVRTNEVDDLIGHRLEYKSRTSLDNLEEIGVLVQIDPPGSGQYIRHHRREENFYDPRSREFVPLLEEEVSRFLDDLTSRGREHAPLVDGGVNEEDGDDEEKATLRAVAASVLDVDEDDVEHELSERGNPIDRMNRFDKVVQTIKKSEQVTRRRNYDQMGWRNSALRWSLSERAAHLEMNQSLPS